MDTEHEESNQSQIHDVEDRMVKDENKENQTSNDEKQLSVESPVDKTKEEEQEESFRTPDIKVEMKVETQVEKGEGTSDETSVEKSIETKVEAIAVDVPNSHSPAVESVDRSVVDTATAESVDRSVVDTATAESVESPTTEAEKVSISSKEQNIVADKTTIPSAETHAINPATSVRKDVQHNNGSNKEATEASPAYANRRSTTGTESGHRPPGNRNYDRSHDRKPDGFRDRDKRDKPWKYKKYDKIAAKKLTIDYKSPEILKDFLTPQGKIVSAFFTGNSAKNQRKLTQEIKRARFIGLLPSA